MPKSPRMINFLNFNQNGSCISMGTSDGFEIFNCEPFGKFCSDETGGYGIVEMLFSTSLLAVVGVGDQPAMSPRRLRILNTKRHSTICEVTFPSTILAVKMNRSRLVVLLQDQIYIYDISNMRLLHTIETTSNSNGLVTISPSLESNYLAYPSPPKIINSEIKGLATTNNITLLPNEVIPSSGAEVSSSALTGSQDAKGIVTFDSSAMGPGTNHNAKNNSVKNGDVILFNLQTLQPAMVIEAHKGEIAALTISPDGTLLATASDKGTIIRVFSVETGSKVYQFRRGTYPTKICSMSFSDDNRFLAASSSSRTVHIFKLAKTASDPGKVDNQNSSDIEDHSVFSGEDIEDVENDEIGSIGSHSAASFGSSHDDHPDPLKEPVIDSSRRTVGRMIRKSSQKLSRKAAKTLGAYFPIKVTSILEPSRHFASLKLPVENNNAVKTIASVGSPVEIHSSEYPDLFEDGSWGSRDRNHGIMKVLPVRVISSEGFMYNYILDPERGGDCLLLSQYSLLMS
ncbi:LAMI_0A06238g1_1 [Lachancea mirantina]|uniref:LAMI_0A06238g1_1 n=1 Tax=Lachancea mirantina TaxID=1230905 RepID=A0A1G4IQI6_9SACH|nr:LAMI_0A06238g1_1 [Lachancea mirantina]